MRSSNTDIVTSKHNTDHGSVSAYVIGFVLSLILTLASFLIVINKLASGWAIMFTLMGLAAIQLIVQVVFFLHMGREAKPRWNLQVFLFMILTILIVVIGSLWIMHNLHYNMTPQEVREFIFEEQGIRR